MTKLFGLKGLAVAAIAAIAGIAFAQDASAQSQTSTFSTSVTVQNTFTVGMTTPLNLGTIAAIADPTAGTQAQLVVAGNTGTATVTQGGGTARILQIAAATPGVISISAAPPSTLITITQGAQIQLTDPAQTGETTFNFTPAAVCAAFNCTTDATGALTVNVGGTLATRQQTSAGAEDNGYSDGTYTGTYSVTFAY